MSREERRQYERMMRSMERGPALPPAARTRAERNAARRAQRAGPSSGRALTTRFFVVSTLVAFSVGFIGFSLQWPNMPFALYLGIALAAATFALQIGLRLLFRRRGRSTPG